MCLHRQLLSLYAQERLIRDSLQSSRCPPLRLPASPTARLALGQNASPVIPTYTKAYPFS